MAGSFTSLQGSIRGGVAAFDMVGSGSLTSFSPMAGDEVHQMAIQGSAMAIGGMFGSVNMAYRSRLAAVDKLSGAILPWDPNADDTVKSIVDVGDGTPAVGGDFDTVGAVTHHKLAVIDAASAVVDSWAPGVPNGSGGTIAQVDVIGNSL